MGQLQEYLKKHGAFHHAYIIEGEKGRVLEQLADFFEQDLGISLANNPDYFRAEFETFGIEEAHLLKERQSFLSVAAGQSSAKKIFVISAERFSVEAQNALLKILEEPTAGTHIFFIVPDASRVLPTVRSRVVFIRESAGASRERKTNAFLTASYGEREKLITPLAEEKNRAGAFALLSGIEDALKERLERTGDRREYHLALAAVSTCRAHLGGRAPSLKMLLEYLAVALPVVKTLDN